MLYLQSLRLAEPKRRVLMVDKRVDTPHAQAASQRYRAHVLHGDISSPAVLDSLRLQRAARVVLLTGDDYPSRKIG